VGTTETALRTVTVAGLTQTANTSYRVAFRAVTSGGTTTLSAKLWLVGTTEPSAWTTTVTDATAGLQSGGSVGVNSYMSSSAAAAVTMRVDDFAVVDPD
jgi:large repetitive protein